MELPIELSIVNVIGIIPADWFFMTWLVMVSSDSTNRWLSQVPDWRVSKPKQFVTRHPPRIRLLLTRRERRIFDNCGLVLTLYNCPLVGTSIIFTVVFPR